MWVAVVFMCASVNVVCDETNAYDRMVYATAYPTQIDCERDTMLQLARMPEMDDSVRATMVCKRL